MFAVSGRRPQDNLFLLNGVEYTGASLINVTPGGTSGQLLGVEAVREFNVITDTYSAAYGKRQGAQVSIVTAGGTNSSTARLRVPAQLLLRRAQLLRPRAHPRVPAQQLRRIAGRPDQEGQALPLRQLRGLSPEPRRLRRHLRARLNAATAWCPTRHGGSHPSRSVQASLACSTSGRCRTARRLSPDRPSHRHRRGFSSAPQHIREDFGTTRFDANLTPNDLLFAVYTIDDSIAHTPTQDPYSLVNENLREQVASVQEQHVFSPRLLNTARAGFSRASFYFLGSVPADIQAVTPTFLAGNAHRRGRHRRLDRLQRRVHHHYGGRQRRLQQRHHAQPLHLRRPHLLLARSTQIEAGGWLQLLESNDNLAQDQDGQASFASLTTFLQGTIKTFTYVPSPPNSAGAAPSSMAISKTPSNHAPTSNSAPACAPNPPTDGTPRTAAPRLRIHQRRHQLHAHHRFLLRPHHQPRAVPSRAAPRPLLRSRSAPARPVLRASFGLHHALLDTLDYRLDQSAPFNTIYSTSGTVANPTSGASLRLTLHRAARHQHAHAVSRGLCASSSRSRRRPRSPSATSARTATTRSSPRISNEPATVVAARTAPSTTPTTTKPNPALANTTCWVSQGSSSYNALEVDLRRSLANGLSFRANYTYARNLDDGSAWNTSVSANTPAFVDYPNNPALDWGPAATDIRNLASINASYDLPFGKNHLLLANARPFANAAVSGWTLSAIATLESGFPFSPQLGYNPTGSGDSRNPVRPNVNPAFTGSLYTQGTTAQKVAQYFNPAAFSAPAYGTVGNAPPRHAHRPRLQRPRPVAGQDHAAHRAQSARSSAPSSSTSSTTPTCSLRPRQSSPPGPPRAPPPTRPAPLPSAPPPESSPPPPPHARSSSASNFSSRACYEVCTWVESLRELVFCAAWKDGKRGTGSLSERCVARGVVVCAAVSAAEP